MVLLPADRISGLRTRETDGANTSSWGGQVLRDDNGMYHMWAAEIINHCGINAWTRNSRIIHAISKTPGGLYERKNEIKHVFAHEPSVTRAPDGTYVMYYTAFLNSVKLPPCNCSDGSTPKDCTDGTYSKDPSFMATAQSIEGPWSIGKLVPLADCNSTFCQHDMNLAGVILPNGSFVGMVKVHGTPVGAKHALSEIHQVTARDWRDSNGYVQAPNDESGNLFPKITSGGLEDPEIYQDANGYYHALFHLEKGTFSGGHACSMDGVHWKYTGVAYNTTVHFRDGTITTFDRRERPHIIFADSKRPHIPTHLTNGVVYGMSNGDASYTLVQPIEN